MNIIPCIKDKCLIYPICKLRKKITCQILHEFVYKYRYREGVTYNERLQYIHIWWNEYISPYFTNIKVIESDYGLHRHLQINL